MQHRSSWGSAYLAEQTQPTDATMLVALQMMVLGGNGRARQFFKQHGVDDFGSDKIETKVCMCYAWPSCFAAAHSIHKYDVHGVIACIRSCASACHTTDNLFFKI